MLWPTRPDTWNNSARPAQTAFAAVAHAIARFEPVTVGVHPGKEESARALLFQDADMKADAGGGKNGITVVAVEQDDAWMRDTGPLFVVRSSSASSNEDEKARGRHVRGVDFSFNAWGGASGGCFSSWEKDNAIAGVVLGLVGAERYKADMILEVSDVITGLQYRPSPL